MIKYTKHFLKKIEDLFKELEYTVRYERGNFKSGYCIVEDKQIAVINRFFEVEARINVLLEILNNVEIDATRLDEKNATFFKQLKAFAGNDAQAAKAAAEEVEKNLVETKESESIEQEVETAEVETAEAVVESEVTTPEAEPTVTDEAQMKSEAEVLE